MKVKLQGTISTVRKLIGGSAQGSLLGGTQYIVASNNVAADVSVENKYRYFDDIEILDLILLSNILVDYDFKSRVASDIGIGHKFLPPQSYNMQAHLNNIISWTDTNCMKLNLSKSNYMIFTRSQTHFSTRLSLGNMNVEQVRAVKLLGVWLTEDLS